MLAGPIGRGSCRGVRGAPADGEPAAVSGDKRGALKGCRPMRSTWRPPSSRLDRAPAVGPERLLLAARAFSTAIFLRLVHHVALVADWRFHVASRAALISASMETRIAFMRPMISLRWNHCWARRADA